MLFALIDGEKVIPEPSQKAKCPSCRREVFAKCGEVNIWHWSHKKDESCDSWYEPETPWHRNWKLVFGKENSEIVISKNGVRHFADVLTEENVVIELQNSPIQKPIIRRRESFYGERMLWVVNGVHFKDHFRIYPAYSGSLRNRFWEPNYQFTEVGVVDRITGEIVHPPTNESRFEWSWARKSWAEVMRPVFIDFGDENLYRVKEGMGTASGFGQIISKEKFLKKYGGNLNLLSTIIVEK